MRARTQPRPPPQTILALCLLAMLAVAVAADV
jgi:hypothetical protein